MHVLDASVRLSGRFGRRTLTIVFAIALFIGLKSLKWWVFDIGAVLAFHSLNPIPKLIPIAVL